NRAVPEGGDQIADAGRAHRQAELERTLGEQRLGPGDPDPGVALVEERVGPAAVVGSQHEEQSQGESEQADGRSDLPGGDLGARRYGGATGGAGTGRHRVGERYRLRGLD